MPLLIVWFAELKERLERKSLVIGLRAELLARVECKSLSQV